MENQKQQLTDAAKIAQFRLSVIAPVIHGLYPDASRNAYYRRVTEDKKEAITGIGDDHIREDGMGMPAAYADQPEDRDFLCDGFPMDKIDDAAAIVSMDMAVAGGTADGAGLPFGAERSHIGLEQNF